MPGNDGLASETEQLQIRLGSLFDFEDFIKFPENTPFYQLEPVPAPAGSPLSQEGVVGQFGWTQSFLIPYKAEIGGYNLNVVAFSGTEAFIKGSAGVDAYSTFTLETVAYSNGEAITGPITFDSGFVLPVTAVPEPSSLMIVTTLLAVVALSRRGRSALLLNRQLR